MKKHTFLAIDIGATSGRAVIASVENGKLEMQEAHRFANNITELHGRYYWDVFSLCESIKTSLSLCARQGVAIDSMGIDTWGVDYGFVGADGSLTGMPRAYRDPYTEGAPDDFFRLIPREEVYRLTGIQIMNFNSLFQLYRARQQRFAPLEAAAEILFIPDLLSYMLTGNKVCEYTIASTSQLLNPAAKEFEPALLKAAGVSPSLLRRPVMPGTFTGLLTDSLAKETGIGKIPVIAVAGHDTASAVAAVPATGTNFAYLSSGTWSLMGIEVEQPIITAESCRGNFTNEGGIEGTTRFLKNITGMWLLEQCRKEWERSGQTYAYPQIVAMAAEAAAFPSVVNPDDPSFANPECMTAAIAAYCRQTGQREPSTHAEFVRCIFASLSNRYGETLAALKKMAPFPIEKLHVIGGGSRNNLLNRFTANAVGIPVIAGPAEATAIGNIMIQAKAAGLVKDRWEMRRLIAEAFPPEIFLPGKQ
ncbi:MAG: rhamnulokinase [Tannerellaceae bacterium]|jgi:rhamnulokinase|nr:rhamnulokinase [Tannerellaceae bacterium]